MELKYKNYITVQPRFSETDMMRVIHHGSYWSWFEESRFFFLEEVLGVSVRDMESSLILMPVIDCSCNYIKKIKWGESLKVMTRLEVSSAPYFHFHHEIYYASDANHENLLCRARVKQAFVDEHFRLRLKVPSFFSASIAERQKDAQYAFILKEKI